VRQAKARDPWWKIKKKDGTKGSQKVKEVARVMATDGMHKEAGAMEEVEDGIMVDNDGKSGIGDGKNHGQGREPSEKVMDGMVRAKARKLVNAKVSTNEGASPPSQGPMAGTGMQGTRASMKKGTKKAVPRGKVGKARPEQVQGKPLAKGGTVGKQGE